MFVRSSLVLLALSATLAHAQYTVSSLHPAGFAGSDAHAAYGGVQVGRAFDFSGPLIDHAESWGGTAASGIDRHPAPYNPNGLSEMMGIWQNQAVGVAAGDNVGGVGHAFLWDLALNSYTDLAPTGSTYSQANAIDGTMQVGQATIGGNNHAGFWTGSAASFVDLHPTGANISSATAVGGGTQGGYSDAGGVFGAALWSGTAASYVSLHPAGFDGSQVNAIDGAFQGGSGYGTATGGASHALLWNGTAGSVVDLHPAGQTDSRIQAMANGEQVGLVAIGSTFHAFLWHGSATVGTLDLHQFLSADYDISLAFGIDPITGDIVGQAHNSVLDKYEAVIWRPAAVPEPASLVVLGLSTLALLRRKKCSRGL